MQAAAQSTAQVATASNYDFRSGCKVLTQSCRYGNECLSECCADDVCMNENECDYPASLKYSIRPNPEIYRFCSNDKAKDVYVDQLKDGGFTTELNEFLEKRKALDDFDEAMEETVETA